MRFCPIVLTSKILTVASAAFIIVMILYREKALPAFMVVLDRSRRDKVIPAKAHKRRDEFSISSLPVKSQKANKIYVFSMAPYKRPLTHTPVFIPLFVSFS